MSTEINLDVFEFIRNHINPLYASKFGQNQIDLMIHTIKEYISICEKEYRNRRLRDIDIVNIYEILRKSLRRLCSSDIMSAEEQNEISFFELKYLPRKTLNQKPYLFTQDWFNEHIADWTNICAQLSGKPDLRFLEVGCFEGRCTCWILENVLTSNTSNITCIDPFLEHNQQEKFFLHNVRITGSPHKVFILKGRSQSLLSVLPNNYYDFIYIDGSHQAMNVLQDAILSWPIMKPGALLVFDDYEYCPGEGVPGPKEGIDAFLKTIECSYDIIKRGWQLVIRKK